MRGAFTARGVVLGLAVSVLGCERGTGGERTAQTALPLTEAASCDTVKPTSPAPGWLAGPKVVAAGATAQLSLPTASGSALVVLQNGNGLGQNGVASVKLLLDGVQLATPADLPPLTVIPVVVAPGDVLGLTAYGTVGTVRLAVASAVTPPCPLASVSLTRADGGTQTASTTFDRPDSAALGLVRVANTSLTAGDGVVTLNGQTVVGVDDTEGDTVAVVPLAATNTLSLRLGGTAIRTVTVTVFDLDSTSPTVAMTAPVDGFVSKATTLTATGTASRGATRVSVDGVRSTLDAGVWSVDLPDLAEGDHTVTAAARDFCGNVARSCASVAVDLHSPVISITGVSAGALRNAPVTPVWSATDDHLKAVTARLDGTVIAPGTLVDAEGDHVLVVNTSDFAGNTSRKSVSFSLDFTPPVVSVSGISDGQVAAPPVALSFGATDAHLGKVTALLDGASFVSGGSVAAEGNHVLVVTATDGAGNVATRSVSFQLVTPCTDAPLLAPLDALAAAVADANALKLVGEPQLLALLSRNAQITADVARLRASCTAALRDDLLARVPALTADLRTWLASGPVGMLSTPRASVLVGDTFDYLPRLSTAGDAGFSFALTTSPAAASIDPQTGRVTWLPALADKGPHDFAIAATQGLITARQVFTVLVSEKRKVMTVPIDSSAKTVTVTSTGTTLDGTVVGVPAGFTAAADTLILSVVDPAPSDAQVRMSGPALDVALGSGRSYFDVPLEVDLPDVTPGPGEAAGTFLWLISDAAGSGCDGDNHGVWTPLQVGTTPAQTTSAGTVASGRTSDLRAATAGRHRLFSFDCPTANLDAVGYLLQQAEQDFVSAGFMLNHSVRVAVRPLPYRGEAPKRDLAIIQCGLTGTELGNTVAHELFHLEQMQLKGTDVITRGGGQWLAEATAEYMGTRFTGGDGSRRLAQPRTMVEQTLTNVGDLHEYDSFIYFDYLATTQAFWMKNFWTSIAVSDLTVGEPNEAAARALISWFGATHYMDFVHAYNGARQSNFSLMNAAVAAPQYDVPSITSETAQSLGGGALDFLSSRTFEISVDGDGDVLVTFNGANAVVEIYDVASGDHLRKLSPSADEVNLGPRKGRKLWLHVGNPAIAPNGATFDLSVRLKTPPPPPTSSDPSAPSGTAVCTNPGPLPALSWNTPTYPFPNAGEWCAAASKGWGSGGYVLNGTGASVSLDESIGAYVCSFVLHNMYVAGDSMLGLAHAEAWASCPAPYRVDRSPDGYFICRC